VAAPVAAVRLAGKRSGKTVALRDFSLELAEASRLAVSELMGSIHLKGNPEGSL